MFNVCTAAGMVAGLFYVLAHLAQHMPHVAG